MKKKHIYLLLLLTVFGIVSFLLPISGDDYGCFVTSYGSLSSSFKEAVRFYFTWEGRFIGRIFILMFSYHKVIFNIFTTLLLGLLYLGILKLTKPKKVTYLLLMIGLLFLNTDMFSQTLTWVAGTCTYFYPSILVILYFVYIWLKDKPFKWYTYLIFVILNIIGCMFVENIGCALVIGNIILAIYYFKKDPKKFRLFLILSFISSISLGVMLLSPGSKIRSLENVDFNNLSLISKVISNFSNFNEYLFTKNIVLIILMLVVINKALKLKNVGVWKRILVNIIPIITVITNLKYYTPIYLSFLDFNIPSYLDFKSSYYIVFWLLFLGIYIYSIYVLVGKNKIIYFYYFMILVGLSSIAPMMILPVWGDRITYFLVIILSFISILVINEFISDKLYKYVLVFTILLFINFIGFSFLAFRINSDRVDLIYEEVSQGRKEVDLLYNPVTYLWNNNILSGDYFINTYRSYLNLPQDITFVWKRPSYKKYIGFKK